MTSVFLEVLTRCWKRPLMLLNNQQSLDDQTDGDWIQTLLIDRKGIGVSASQITLRRYADQLAGEYIWILDDDDMCVRPSLVAELKAIVAEYDPDVIMMRMDHGPRGVLPDDAHWGKRPAVGYVGVSAYVVKRAVWQAHARAWSEKYVADGEFIEAIFASEPAVYWHDVIASRTQRISMGEPE